MIITGMIHTLPLPKGVTTPGVSRKNALPSR
jgi:hypothetical protein